MLCKVVTMYGTPKSMSNQELYSVIVQMCWQLKLRACENMQVQWCRKDVEQLIILTRRRLWWSPL